MVACFTSSVEALFDAATTGYRVLDEQFEPSAL